MTVRYVNQHGKHWVTLGKDGKLYYFEHAHGKTKRVSKDTYNSHRGFTVHSREPDKYSFFFRGPNLGDPMKNITASDFFYRANNMANVRTVVNHLWRNLPSMRVDYEHHHDDIVRNVMINVPDYRTMKVVPSRYIGVSSIRGPPAGVCNNDDGDISMEVDDDTVETSPSCTGPLGRCLMLRIDIPKNLYTDRVELILKLSRAHTGAEIQSRHECKKYGSLVINRYMDVCGAVEAYRKKGNTVTTAMILDFKHKLRQKVNQAHALQICMGKNVDTRYIGIVGLFPTSYDIRFLYTYVGEIRSMKDRTDSDHYYLADSTQLSVQGIGKC